MIQAQQAFNRLVSRDLSEASPVDIKTLALAIWHEEFIPDTVALDIHTARSGLYLIDALMRFNCVSVSSKSELRCLLSSVSFRFNLWNELYVNRTSRVSDIAIKWGLTSDVRLLLRDLLPYQTRHYKHTKAR